ncbi:Potassium voltage-gated channel subfamily H member 7 [Tetrabaena socialis]|uniref:Potassium voltage-gated channel subfamily H member 7 n=1 Tax=Tetrabaena socialis TaxID=47790 RepID=A0A2J7ZUL3_9CHLO|nr:Potassium voltage-gated channel subfamily H member 7 [Tetrabaena socialis]|eukprot:PNH03952.1 Potassium voltage-gated channel subfamily H member 7 [Tetrabaena socialis]
MVEAVEGLSERVEQPEAKPTRQYSNAFAPAQLHGHGHGHGRGPMRVSHGGGSTTGAGSLRQASLRRSASSFIERPSLWYRITHADVRGILDSLLPIYSPNTLARRAWDLLIMALVIWTAITVPLSVSYGLPAMRLWDAIGYTVTGLFVIDLLVNFRTAFYNHQGELVRDAAAISANYMKVWFWIDLFGTIPFDSIVLWTGVLSGSSDNTLAALGFLKAPRMLRLGRLLRFLDSFKNAKIFRIVQLFLGMILISHWLACVWFMMYRFGGSEVSERWAFQEAEDVEPEKVSAYIKSFYFSFLLLMGDNIAAYNNFERTFFCVVELGGVFIYSAVMGQMATLVATMNVTISRHGWGGAGVPLFANLERGFLRALATRVQLASLHPGEAVFRAGDVGHTMYFIRKGCIAVSSTRGELCALLPPGQIFGEVALLSTGKRTANCTALGFVDLAVLGKQDLQVVMNDFQQSARLIRQRAAERLRELEATRKMWLPDPDEYDEHGTGAGWEAGGGAAAAGGGGGAGVPRQGRGGVQRQSSGVGDDGRGGGGDGSNGSGSSSGGGGGGGAAAATGFGGE